MPTNAGGGGAASDAMVKTNGAAGDMPEADAKAERNAEIAALVRARDKAEEQLKAAKDALAQARKGTN